MDNYNGMSCNMYTCLLIDQLVDCSQAYSNNKQKQVKRINRYGTSFLTDKRALSCI